MCPQTAANTRSRMANRNINPSKSVKGGQTITVVLNFVDRAFVPEDLFDALETKYGAGKVTNELDAGGHNTFRLKVAA